MHLTALWQLISANGQFQFTILIVVSFLPRDASAERGDATVSRPSVCNDQVP